MLQDLPETETQYWNPTRAAVNGPIPRVSKYCPVRILPDLTYMVKEKFGWGALFQPGFSRGGVPDEFLRENFGGRIGIDEGIDG